MRHTPWKRAVGLLIVLGVAVGAAVLLASKPDAPYDRAFDVRVASPAYSANGPVVLFDEGHRNTHTTQTGYKPLADLFRNDGYQVRTSLAALSPERLADVSVLVLALGQGANVTNDASAYSPTEMAAVEHFVRRGGSLLLITDHWPYGSAVQALGRRFGVTMGAGLVQDPLHADSIRGDSHLVFTTSNGLLREHPVVRGRMPTERITSVITFTGQSLSGPPGAVAFLALSDSATERLPTPAAVDSSNGNVRISMEYGAPVASSGRAQGLAFSDSAGRVVVLGEAGMLRAQRARGGQAVGMNMTGYDNRQLALNIMHWLSRLL